MYSSPVTRSMTKRQTPRQTKSVQNTPTRPGSNTTTIKSILKQKRVSFLNTKEVREFGNKDDVVEYTQEMDSFFTDGESCQSIAREDRDSLGLPDVVGASNDESFLRSPTSSEKKFFDDDMEMTEVVDGSIAANTQASQEDVSIVASSQGSTPSRNFDNSDMDLTVDVQTPTRVNTPAPATPINKTRIRLFNTPIKHVEITIKMDYFDKYALFETELLNKYIDETEFISGNLSSASCPAAASDSSTTLLALAIKESETVVLGYLTEFYEQLKSYYSQLHMDYTPLGDVAAEVLVEEEYEKTKIREAELGDLQELGKAETELLQLEQSISLDTIQQLVTDLSEKEKHRIELEKECRMLEEEIESIVLEDSTTEFDTQMMSDYYLISRVSGIIVE